MFGVLEKPQPLKRQTSSRKGEARVGDRRIIGSAEIHRICDNGMRQHGSWFTNASCAQCFRFARLRKFTHEQYQSYLLQCRRSYRTLLLNAQAVQEAEATAALTLGPMRVLFSYFCFPLAKSLVFLVASFLLPCKCEEIIPGQSC